MNSHVYSVTGVKILVWRHQNCGMQPEEKIFLFICWYLLVEKECMPKSRCWQKKYLIMVELLDNKIVQTKKSIKSTHFYVLNYFIIQKFNPNKMYFFVQVLGILWHALLWVQPLSIFFQHLLFDMNFFEFNHYQLYFNQPWLFEMYFFALWTSLACEGGIREHPY